MGFSKKNVKENLCGPAKTVQRLLDSINLQIRRFNDPRARSWQYGTHDTANEQYLLPDGAGIEDLSAILSGKMNQSSSSLMSTSSDVRNQTVVSFSEISAASAE